MNASCGTSTEPTIFMRFLPFFLFFEQFLLARDITTVALRQHILAQCTDVGTRDDALADGGLHRHDKLLPWYQILEFGDEALPLVVSVVTVHDHRQRIDRFGVDQDIQLDQVTFAILVELIIEAGITPASTLLSRS